MKLEDYDEVTALIDHRYDILSAIKQAEGIESPVDASYCGFNIRHYRETGVEVDLTGCGIILEVLDAVMGILKAKKESVECKLGHLGVEITGGIEL